MFRNNNVQEKAIKTAMLLGIMNLVVYPASRLTSNSSLALLITVAANAFAIYKLHELGKNRRLGSNLLNQANTFVAARVPGGTNVQSMEVENGIRNVINGGAAVTDEIVNGVESLANQAGYRRPGR